MKKNAQKKLKHKPNARHTLNEVLHSLQDMMHNELAGIADGDGSELDKKSGASLSKEEVLSSLKALIGTPENTSQSANPASSSKAAKNPPVDDTLDPDTAAEMLPQDSSDDASKTDKVETKATDTSSIPEPPKGRNETPSPADDFRLEMEDIREPDTPPKAPAKAKKKSRKNINEASTTNAVEQVEINWDDIPVLNEVVAPPPMPDDAATQEARAIAIKVAATLNIEARKKGGDTMDVKAIMRLQSLLSQELQERQDGSDEADDDESGNNET